MQKFLMYWKAVYRLYCKELAKRVTKRVINMGTKGRIQLFIDFLFIEYLTVLNLYVF